MSAAKCVTCSRTVRDYRMCDTCTGRLEQLIAELPALDRELELTETRQTAHGPRNGSRSAEKPVVFNPSAAEVRADLRATLVGWVKDLPVPTQRGPLTVEGMVRRLIVNLPTIRQWPNGDQLSDELGYASKQGWKTVDRPKDRTRIHLCDCLEVSCPGELHAHIPVEDYDPRNSATHSTITCTVCDVVYPAETWMRLGQRIINLLAEPAA